MGSNSSIDGARPINGYVNDGSYQKLNKPILSICFEKKRQEMLDATSCFVLSLSRSKKAKRNAKIRSVTPTRVPHCPI